MAWVNHRVSQADRHISRYSCGEGTMIKRQIALETSQTHLTYTTLPPTTEHLPTALPARNEMVSILMNFIVDC
eukprot:scaffold21717_cov67-Skeletonema_dohrnii-CCMP3373.AAC.2